MPTDRPHIVVIGGGIIGLCTAYYLLRGGCAVTILEKGRPGEGASVGNAGLVVPSHFIPLAAPGVISQGLRWLLDPESPFYIKPRADRQLLSWLWHFKRSSTAVHVERSMRLLRDLHQASQVLYEAIAAEEDLQFEFQRRGLLMLFRTEEGRRSCLHEAELAHTINVRAQVIDQQELSELEPRPTFHATGAVYFPDDSHLSPVLFVEQIRKSLVARGARIHMSTEVHGFDLDRPTTGGTPRIAGVRTLGGTVSGDAFVIAGGAWSPEILKPLGIHMLQQPGKGYSITFRNFRGATPLIPMILTEARVAVTPFSDSVRFAGTMELTGLDLTINQRRVEAILKAIPRYFDLDVNQTTQAREVWSGLRPCSPDGLPYIGSFSAYSNLVAATGHAMIGISLAPITGQIVADLIARKSSSFPLAPLSPERFS